MITWGSKKMTDEEISVDVDLSFRINTKNKEKLDWVLQTVFNLLTSDEDIKKVGLDIK